MYSIPPLQLLHNQPRRNDTDALPEALADQVFE